MNLSPHFELEELTFSQTAVRAGIDNTPDPMQVNNLRDLAAALEKVRIALGDRPLHVSSGYRCPLLNHLVGGAPDSAHMQGLAADITCPSFGTPYQVARAIVAAGLEFDQLILEGTWVHFGLAGGLMPRHRQEVLTAMFRQGRPTLYVKGLMASPAEAV